ncbi:hypothetical protein PM082_018703 [Marasmius tenuissimus]|nr:hypothetical protein PM082_018703 [Marasmius tenuissimus]
MSTPEALFGVHLRQEEKLSFAGTFEPAFMCTLFAITVGNPGMNKKVVENFTKYLEDNLGVKSNRGYIFLENPGANNVGFCGETGDIYFAK